MRCQLVRLLGSPRKILAIYDDDGWTSEPVVAPYIGPVSRRTDPVDSPKYFKEFRFYPAEDYKDKY